jgi:hypothetical protein
MQVLPAEKQHGPGLRPEDPIRVEKVHPTPFKVIAQQDHVREEAGVNMCSQRSLCWVVWAGSAAAVGVWEGSRSVIGVLVLDYEDVSAIHAAGDEAEGFLHEGEDAAVAGVSHEVVDTGYSLQMITNEYM